MSPAPLLLQRPDERGETVQIRLAHPGDGDGIGRVHVETWRTTYAGIVPADYLAELSAKKRGEFWENFILKADPDRFLLVAHSPETGIVGFASGGVPFHPVEGYSGEIYAIYTVKEFQGQGLGRRLMSAGADQLLKRDLRSMLVWVLAANAAARGAYEALGGTPIGSKVDKISGTELEEICYGWSDISDLASGGRDS